MKLMKHKSQSLTGAGPSKTLGPFKTEHCGYMLLGWVGWLVGWLTFVFAM